MSTRGKQSTLSQEQDDSSEISSSSQEFALESVESDEYSSSQSADEHSSAEGEKEEQEISILKAHGKKRKRPEVAPDDGEITTTVTVLSHAERRHQKRREGQRGEQDVLSSKKARRGKGKLLEKGDTTKQRQNSVWVGNLAFKTTVEDLKSFFAGAGEITRVNMPTKAALAPSSRKRENRGFAYVDFSTPEGKAAAIALSEQPLTGRKLLIKDGDDFTGRPNLGVATPRKSMTLSKTAQKILHTQKQPPGPTLFLGNLGFETTEANIKEMLDAHRSSSADKKHRGSDSGAEASDKRTGSMQSVGWIRKVRMGTFEDSGLCKGFAFVDFRSTENAISALVNPKNYFLNGRKLVIEFASPDAVRRGMPRPKPQVNKGEDKSQGRKANFGTLDHAVQHDNADGQDTEEHRPFKRQQVDKGEKASATNKRGTKAYQGPKLRVKPGAALALAQRGSVAIIPSQGKKIKFD